MVRAIFGIIHPRQFWKHRPQKKKVWEEKHQLWGKRYSSIRPTNDNYNTVLVITCLGGRFRINCPNVFLKILKLAEQNEGNFKIFKNTPGQFILNRPPKHVITSTVLWLSLVGLILEYLLPYNWCFSSHTCFFWGLWKIKCNTISCSIVATIASTHPSNKQYRSSRLELFCKKDALRNLTKFTGKHLYQSLFFKRFWHRCFPVNFVKFLRAPFFYRTTLLAASDNNPDLKVFLIYLQQHK